MFRKEGKLEFVDQLLWRGSALPPSDEGGAPKGRRERNKLQSLGFFSPPVSFADSPLVRGGLWGALQLLDKLKFDYRRNDTERVRAVTTIAAPGTHCPSGHPDKLLLKGKGIWRGIQKILLTNMRNSGYNTQVQSRKAVKRRVRRGGLQRVRGWCERTGGGGGTWPWSWEGEAFSLPRVRPSTRLMSRLKSSIPKWGPRKGGWPLWGREDARPLAEFPGKQEMEQCGLCVDEKQGGTASIFVALEYSGAIFLL